MKLDKFDREILRVLQQDATVSMADLSQRVGLSHTPCWRRVKRMEYIHERATCVNVIFEWANERGASHGLCLDNMVIQQQLDLVQSRKH